MKKLAISSIFVASNLLASFLIVIILVRFAETQERADFFLFQTVFFPLTALLSQTKILQIFRGDEASKMERLIDVATFALAAGLLFLIGYDRYAPLDIFCFALSIPITYRTASNFAALQRNSKSGIAWIWPLISATARVLMCLLLLGQTISVVFLASAVVGLVVSSAVVWNMERKATPQEAAPKREQAFFATLFFFAISSFAFQWDRILLGQLELDALIVTSGICLAWVLSPVSALFATLYRARALEIFSDAEAATKRRMFKRTTTQFAGATMAFAAVLLVAWTPLNAIAFPFADIPVILPIILIFAVMFDRIGNLRLFSFAASGAKYRQIGLAKLATILIGVIGVWSISAEISLTLIYGVYLGISLIYCALVWRLT